MLMTDLYHKLIFSVPLYFRATINASNTRAGAYLFPPVFGNAFGGVLAGHLIRRTGKYKTLIVLATLVSCTSYVLLIVRWHGKISAWEVLETLPGGFGMGVVGSGIFIALTASLEQQHIAMATGGMYLASSFGMMMGVAVTTSVQLSSLRWLLGERIRGPESEKVSSEH
jgi:MFS family permease